jgi:hypothetical protein
MPTTFTFKSPEELTSREVYHQLYHSLRRVGGRSPELRILWGTEDLLSRSFELVSGEEADLRKAVADVDLRGCEVVCPAEEQPVVIVEEAPAAAEEAVAETVEAAVETAPAPASRRGRRAK